MILFFWAMLLYLCLYEPLYGYFDYQKFKERVHINSEERIKYYKKVMIGLWIPTIAILCFIIFSPFTLHNIGLSNIVINTTILGKPVTYGAFVLVIIYLLSLCYYIIGSNLSTKMRSEINRIKSEEMKKSKFVDIMPVTAQDKTVWTYVSWTAGITEEIIYRGFAIFALYSLFPSLSIWWVLIISSVLFGLAHTYQGALNVLKTTLFGFIFSILFIGFGSIIPLIILHFLIDYVGKIGDVVESNISEKTIKT
ncbi:CPBP family intramembrane glutamic endopeptidase [Litchfieldia alkalitelluris]|uniref:CPBP family intramembrane glutamic endopeptidase n=1 Tax=Litchfieldia alkalitelluris TaxID=304268 RepID=UPI000997917B|nr:CPBP family intramembrane glutamic endopeptidase [Litchfieldia alkalitelluris]